MKTEISFIRITLMLRLTLSAALLLGTSMVAREAQAQAKIEHVILISIDGLHAVDLDRYVKGHRDSALAGLAGHGLVYTDATTPMPSDSFPGILALLTGGNPRTTGVWYDAAYGRDLADAKSCRAGTGAGGSEYDYSGEINVDKKLMTSIDPGKLAVDPQKNCAPVYPHALVRVNTVFEVVKAAGGRTAWADKHPAYDLVQGPSGSGVDDLYTPEIDSEGAITDSVDRTIDYDAGKVKAILNEIRGLDHAGAGKPGVPAVFGMNFQGVSVAQKLKDIGYLNADAEPSAGLAAALDATDRGLAAMREALVAEKLDATTLFIVTAKHGQSPIDPAKRRIVDSKSVKKIIEAETPGIVASITNDDILLIWLKDSAKAATVAATLEKNRDDLAIDHIFYGSELAAKYGDPASDPRAPDLIVQPVAGVIYTKPTSPKIAEHGGGTPDDRHVALVISNPSLKPATVSQPVATAQVAPSILAALGLDPAKLEAVTREKTDVLPGLRDALASGSH